MIRHARLMFAVVAALLVLAAVALAAGSRTITQTARSGHVKASFTYTTTAKSGLYYTSARLTIVRDGVTGYTAAVVDPGCGAGCQPQWPGTKGHSVLAVDINHTGEPNVILEVNSGGNQCCESVQVYSYSAASGAYIEVQKTLPDLGDALKELSPGGDYRFVGTDGNFVGALTSVAGSGAPIQIYGLVNGALVDVTRTYPSMIAKDAAKWLKLFKGHKSGIGGLVAPWAADEELLGKNSLVQSTLHSELKAGDLNGNLELNGAKYITALNKLLVQLGYEK